MAVADGEIQDEEKLLLETYKARYPRLRRVTQKDYDEAQIELFNKVKILFTPDKFKIVVIVKFKFFMNMTQGFKTIK